MILWQAVEGSDFKRQINWSQMKLDMYRTRKKKNQKLNQRAKN